MARQGRLDGKLLLGNDGFEKALEDGRDRAAVAGPVMAKMLAVSAPKERAKTAKSRGRSRLVTAAAISAAFAFTIAVVTAAAFPAAAA